jgi:peptidoglycan/LPS O-acetylase OafA/YrhL
VRRSGDPAMAGDPSRPDPAPRFTHHPALDGLRGVAVAAVLLYHGGHLRGGFLGVDLFFVLSGYLITSLLLVEARGTGRIALGQFWLRRARRLLPALLVLVVAVALYGRFVANSLQWTAIRNDGLATLAYVANWHAIWRGMPYGADVLGSSPFEHTWSLAIEEQFYLVWPLLVGGLLLLRPAAKVVLWASAAIATLSALLLIGLTFTSASYNSLYLGTHTRIASIAFGAVVASWQEVRRDRPMSAKAKSRLDVVAVAAVLLLAVAWATFDLSDTLLYRGGLTVCGLAVAVIICAVTERRSGLLNDALSVVPFRGLGYISYGLYLWHWPIFLWLSESRTGLGGWTLFAVRVVVSLGVAVASYELIEQPIRHGGWPARRVVPMASVGAVVGALALALMSVGAPHLDLAAPTDGPVYARADGKAPLVALYGDSVAYYLGHDGLAPNARELGVSIADVSQAGCEPLGGITDARDGTHRPVWPASWNNCIDSMQTRLAGSKGPDVSVILFGGALYDAKIDGTWRGPCDGAYQGRARERVGTMISKLQKVGSRVVLVKPAPVVAAAANDSKGFSNPAGRSDCAWQALDPLLSRSGVSWVDLQSHFCTSSTSCALEGGDEYNRRDGIHYRDAAAGRVGRWLVPNVLRAARAAGPPVPAD